MGVRPLRGAILGTGSISVYHWRAWLEIQGVEIVAVANRTRSRAESLAREIGIAQPRIYTDYRELLDQETVDFVDIATAPSVHREQVLAAAAHNVNVLCQKPLATSMEEAVEMVEACEAAGVRCVVNENWRWRRHYRELKDMVQANVIGRPRYAYFRFHKDDLVPKPNGGLPDLLAGQRYLANMPELILYEWGVHPIDVLRFLLGDIERVYAHMSRVSPLVQGEDLAVVNLEFRSGALGVVDISWTSYIPESRRLAKGNLDPFVLEGEKGTIELDPYRDDLIIVTTAEGVVQRPAHPGQTIGQSYQEQFFNAQTHFVNCLRTGECAENEGRDNLRTLAGTFAAYRSARLGCAVALDAQEGSPLKQ